MMERSKLKPTSIGKKFPKDEPAGSGGSLYGAVKLKKTGAVSGSPVRSAPKETSPAKTIDVGGLKKATKSAPPFKPATTSTTPTKAFDVGLKKTSFGNNSKNETTSSAPSKPFNSPLKKTTTPATSKSYNSPLKKTPTPTASKPFNSPLKKTPTPTASKQFNAPLKKTLTPTTSKPFNAPLKKTTTPTLSKPFNASLNKTSIPTAGKSHESEKENKKIDVSPKKPSDSVPEKTIDCPNATKAFKPPLKKSPPVVAAKKAETPNKKAFNVPLKKSSSGTLEKKTENLATGKTKAFDIPLKKAPAVDSKPERSFESPKKTYSTESLNGTGKMSRLDEASDEKTIMDDHSKLWLKGVLIKAKADKSVEKKATEFVKRITDAKGLPQIRRLSIRDNDLVSNFTRAIGNDPALTEIKIDGDCRFKDLCPSLVVGFAEGMRTNLNLKRLIIRNVELGNDFLSALASSMTTNFNLEYLDLSHNHVTNDALVDFCLAMEDNQSLKYVNLKDQHSPIFTLREDLAIEALSKNEYVEEFGIEFQTDSLNKEVKKIIQRNKGSSKTMKDYSGKLLQFLEKEAELAEKRFKQRKQEATAKDVTEDEMPFLYELSELANQYKLPYQTEESSTTNTNSPMAMQSGKKSSMSEIKSNLLTADGEFLTEDFISQYLEEGDDGSLTFDFNNQCKVFRRFSSTDPARALIVKKFVEALVTHPKSSKITHIQMSNTMIGNDFLIVLGERCLKEKKLLSKLHLLNFETNYITGPGVTALAKCIEEPEVWKYLQAIKLDNQKQLISSDAEADLANALCVCRSIIKVSLRVRTLFEQRKINDFVVRNIDFLRQARRWHGLKTGTIKERERNKIEKLFDSIAANDASITEVEVVSDQIFVSLNPEEVIKAAESFTNNTHVKKIKMSGLRLDDHFGIALGEALMKNSSVEKVDVENNYIGSDGLLGLISALKTNRTITEMLVRHQSKPLASTDEEKIPELIDDNDVILKLSVDLRSIGARDSVEKKMRNNQDKKRRSAPKRAASGKRNKIQQFFDNIAANDPKITEVEVVNDQVFICLKSDEVEKAAASFANNTHVKKVKMSGLNLDDKFAIAMAESLKSNTTIEKLDLERNSIGSDGMIALVSVLETNRTLTEMYLRYQSKPMSSPDEEKLPGLVDNNDLIIKLSMDIRSMGARNGVDKKLRINQELKRKNRKK